MALLSRSKINSGSDESNRLFLLFFLLCSLHAQSFDASDSRPGSGTRLSPLDHVCSYHTLTQNMHCSLRRKVIPE